MSPVGTFGVLAFASAALAVPFGHENHRHLHHEAREAQGTYGESSAPTYGESSTLSAPAYGSSSSASAPPYPFTPSSGAYPYPTGWGATGTGWGTGSLSATGWYPSWSASSVSAADSTCTAQSTQIWRTKSATATTSLTTIYVSPSRAPTSYDASASLEAAACTPDTTITTKVTQYITITAGATSSFSSAPVAPESYPSDGSSAAYTSAPSSAAPVSESTAPSYGTASSIPAPATYAPATTSVTPSSQTSAEASAQTSSESLSLSPLTNVTSATSGLSGGKRGLAYNTASLCTPFIGLANIGFAYNWVSNSAGLDSSIPYIPELHDMSDVFTSVWMSDAQSAIDAGAEYLFGFNEPDIASQANLSPSEAAAGWMTYMEPFAGKVKLVAPAVSNSGEAGQGLSWLSEFFTACAGCHFDAINLHWYDYTSNDISSLQDQVTSGASQANLPIFLGEFGFIGSDSDISSSLSTAMAWLDSEDSVLGYAYYFLDDGLLLDGTTPSAYGLTYLG